MNQIVDNDKKTAYFHLPGLFEFYDFYREFLPLFTKHREYFFDWCEIGSVYGAPADAIWGGGRIECGEVSPREVLELMNEFRISPRLTFSNSLLESEHLSDRKCNEVCALFEKESNMRSGVIVHSDLLCDYLRSRYPGLYLVSSTTKVLTEFNDLLTELRRDEFEYVVPDFRLNKEFDKLDELTSEYKDKIEFLCNECCDFNCPDRKNCYENVSRKMLGIQCEDHICVSAQGAEGYRFSKAMKNPAFIGIDDILNTYVPMGFSNFKIEGRGLGSALLLEFILFYMTKPEYRLNVREELYLDCMLDLF